MVCAYCHARLAEAIWPNRLAASGWGALGAAVVIALAILGAWVLKPIPPVYTAPVAGLSKPHVGVPHLRFLRLAVHIPRELRRWWAAHDPAIALWIHPGTPPDVVNWALVAHNPEIGHSPRMPVSELAPIAG